MDPLYQSFRTESSIAEEANPNAVSEESPIPADDMLVTVQREPWYQQRLAVLVVGASGDLAKKKTYPALFELWKAFLLPTNTIIYGFARTPHSHDQLRKHIRPYLIKHCCSTNPTEREINSVDIFLGLCFYKNGSNYGDIKVLQEILTCCIPLQNILVYLAIPPNVFGESTKAFKAAFDLIKLNGITLNGFLRVILEKPFGHDSASCQALLATLKQQNWHESELYRIDHYLGKEMVQNIITIRQRNPWLQSIWNNNVIHAVHLIFKEPFGTEGRGGYFDGIGIIRDVLQNHLLQALTLIAMDIPSKEESDKPWTADEIRDAKVQVLKSMPLIKLEDCLLGQYDGYADDTTIENKETTTPTYACVRTWVHSEMWTGVPFILEAGKALDERNCEIRLHFRGSHSNVLVFRLQPLPAVYLTTNMKRPGYSNNTMNTRIGLEYNESAHLPDAYTKLVLDALRGQQANFVRDDELVEAWKIFTPMLHEQESMSPRPILYKSGSSGPAFRDKFLQEMGIDSPSLPIPSAL